MKLFGYELTRSKAAVAPMGLSDWGLARVGGWIRLIAGTVSEPFTGAWQRNLELSTENVLTFAAVFSCVTLILTDVAKLRIKLMQLGTNGIWNEVESPAFSPVLRKPNHYQTRIKFIEQWMASKLIHGNAYILKERDNRKVVTSLYVLDPTRVRVMVAPDGGVWYRLSQDNLTGAKEVMAPASEIIHDAMPGLYHPLCGVSPITACGLAAAQGLNVQRHSSNLFANGARPGGLLVTPGTIDPESAKTLQEQWESNYGGENAGRTAVLGNGLTYQQMTMTSVDAQLIEQLKWTAENVCTAFHVPPYMIGVGTMPTYNNIEALNQQYYSQCLQTHLESIELLLDEALGLDAQVPEMGTEFDLDALLRMDTATRIKAAAESVGSGCLSPNEARARYFDVGPTEGGEGPYLQQQNYSLAALAKRDAQADPFGTLPQAPSPPKPPATGNDQVKRLTDLVMKEMAYA